MIVGRQKDDMIDAIFHDVFKQSGPFGAITTDPGLRAIPGKIGPKGPTWSMGEEIATIFQVTPCFWASSNTRSSQPSCVSPSIVRLGLSARGPLSPPPPSSAI